MKYATKEQLKAFELSIIKLWEAGELPYLIHLSGGNEDQLIEIFNDVNEGDWILSNHRNHYHYLLSGGSPEKIEKMIVDGNSMFVFDKEIRFISSAILGGMCGIAAGISLNLKLNKSKSKVWCFIGDGAEDNGHIYEAVKYVESLSLPCVFVIEDNNRSVNATRDQRGSRYSMQWPNCVRVYSYTPTFPHAGSGCKHKITFKRTSP